MTYLSRGLARLARRLGRKAAALEVSAARAAATLASGGSARQHVRTEHEPDTPWQVHFVRIPLDTACK